MISPALAFTPAQVILDPNRFAGRRTELNEISDALQMPGGHIMIYGNRGVGKSSLAQQMMLMAQGHATLIDRLDHKPFENFDFLPIYLQCDDTIRSVDDIIVRLLTTQGALADWIPYRVQRVEGADGGSGGLSLKILRFDVKAENKIVVEAPEVTNDLRATFYNALDSVRLAKVATSGILIVIDEFDQVHDRSGLASMLKSLDPAIKVALVGVSTNVSELIGEHESVARQFTGGCVKVSPMDDAEIDDLFDRAEQVLEAEVTFPAPARRYITQLAKGHPFLVHLLGWSSTIAAIRSGHKQVENTIVDAALTEVALKGTAPIQESLYKKAVASSYTREVVLKEFASETEDEIHTTPLYKRIAEKLGMQDPNAISVYMGHLTSERYGAVLQRPKDRFYRFTDSLFKAYAASRPFLHSSSNIEDVE